MYSTRAFKYSNFYLVGRYSALVSRLHMDMLTVWMKSSQTPRDFFEILEAFNDLFSSELERVKNNNNHQVVDFYYNNDACRFLIFLWKNEVIVRLPQPWPPL